MAAYTVGAEGGGATCQYQVAALYGKGKGVDADYEQALPWIQKVKIFPPPSPR